MGGKLRGILHANFDLKLYSFCVPRASEHDFEESHSQQMESARGRHSNAAAALNPRRDALRRANFQVVKYKGFLLCGVPKANADQGHSAHLHFGRSDFNDGNDALKTCRKGRVLISNDLLTLHHF